MWLLIYSFLIGGGAARLPEPGPLTEERVVRPPPGVRDPTRWQMRRQERRASTLRGGEGVGIEGAWRQAGRGAAAARGDRAGRRAEALELRARVLRRRARAAPREVSGGGGSLTV